MKNTERHHHSSGAVPLIYQIQQTSLYLDCGNGTWVSHQRRKPAELPDHFLAKWSFRRRLSGIDELFICHGEQCFRVDHAILSNVNNGLYSCHKEADTRLALHAYHAAESFDTVIVKLPDTDVAIILIGLVIVIFRHQAPEGVWQPHWD